MKFNMDKRIRAGYMTAFILLFFSYIITFYTASKLGEQMRLINYTNNLIKNFEYLLSEVKDAQRSTRGYFIVGDSSFLTPYKSSVQAVDSVYNNLVLLLQHKDYAADNKAQYNRLLQLRDTIKNEYAVMEAALQSFRQNNLQLSDSIREFEYRNKDLMDYINAEVTRLQYAETSLMQGRIKDLNTFIQTLQAINIVSLVIAILLSAYSITIFNRENAAKKKADQKADEYHTELEERIKELHQTNEELVRLRSIEKFAATGRIARTIAHEVRNPLTNISLATEQLHDELPQNEETELLIRMIDRNTVRINQLITDLLSSTKFAQLSFTKTSVNNILDEALELASDRMELKDIEVKKLYDSLLPEVEVDEEKIKIAFLNLIVNAIEAMEAGRGKLIITTQHNKDTCFISIADNGQGVSKEHMQRLFEPYFTSKARGTGLGLTNTQNIILNHRGNIRAQSEQGKGTTFIIELPLAAGGDAHPADR